MKVVKELVGPTLYFTDDCCEQSPPAFKRPDAIFSSTTINLP